MDTYIIAIDFDETICTGGWPDITKGKIIKSTLNKMCKQIENVPSTDFILWTCREGKYFNEAVEFCIKHNLPIKYFNEQHPCTENFYRNFPCKGMPEGKTLKIFAHEYWDDKAVRV